MDQESGLNTSATGNQFIAEQALKQELNQIKVAAVLDRITSFLRKPRCFPVLRGKPGCGWWPVNVDLRLKLKEKTFGVVITRQGQPSSHGVGLGAQCNGLHANKHDTVYIENAIRQRLWNKGVITNYLLSAHRQISLSTLKNWCRSLIMRQCSRKW